MSKSKRLRELIATGPVMLPGVPNAAIARQVERAGFDAVYISGAGMANATAGLLDSGLLSMTEVIWLAGYVASAVTIPAIVDADTGPVARRRSPARFVNWKRQARPVATLKIRNFPSAVDISQANQCSRS
jgi:2-methylisocitrate lyase-like PEP mutase family enzyme